MPFHLPPNQAEALKDVRKLRDLARKFDNRHRSLFFGPELEALDDVIAHLGDLQNSLRIPPALEDQ